MPAFYLGSVIAQSLKFSTAAIVESTNFPPPEFGLAVHRAQSTSLESQVFYIILGYYSSEIDIAYIYAMLGQINQSEGGHSQQGAIEKGRVIRR